MTDTTANTDSSIPDACPDCGADLYENVENDVVPKTCSKCDGYYSARDESWVSADEIQDIVQQLWEHAAQARDYKYGSDPDAVTAVSEDAPQPVHDIREALSLEAAEAIPQYTDLDTDEQAELLRRLTVAIHRTTASYLQSPDE